MAISVSENTFDPLPEGVADAKLYRYGQNFFVGEQDALILFCEEHKKKGAKDGEGPTSVKIVLGLVGPPVAPGEPGAKVRADHYVGIGSGDRERFANMLSILEPDLAAKIKAKQKAEPFDCAKQVGKRAKVLIESEDGKDGYGDRPRVTRFVSLLAGAAAAKAPGARAQAQPAPAARVTVEDSDLPF